MDTILAMDEGKLSLFSDIKFILAKCNDADNIKDILIEGGAKHINYLSEHVTLVIADDNCPEAEEAVELFDKPVVSSLWVHLSLKAKKLLPTEAFSPIKSIFHQVTASFSSNLSPHDIDILASTLTFYGACVDKNVSRSTHFIVATAEPSDLPDKLTTNNQLKIVAPDWVLESVRSKHCCDEVLFDPNLLLPPPPPTPPSPPKTVVHPESEAQSTESNKDVLSRTNPTHTDEQQRSKNDGHQQAQTHAQYKPQPQSQQPSQPNQRMQTLPRPRMPANVIRGVQQPQPKFRPLLLPNNVPNLQRSSIQQPRQNLDPQQPKKVTINYAGQYRKMGPCQNNLDPQVQPSYAPQQQQQQHVAIQPTSNMVQQPNRLPQANVYHQVMMPYPNNHVTPRDPSQQPMINQQQQQTHMINRFQDPSTHMNQRPYQVCLQPQAINPNYQQGNMHRPVYYTQQGSNQMQLRMQQQGAPIHHQQSEHIVYDNFQVNHPSESLTIRPNQGHQPRQPFPHPHQQQQPQAQQIQQPQSIMHPRPQFQPNFTASGPNVHQVRTARNLFNNQHEPNLGNVRLPNSGPQVVQHGKGIRMLNNNHAQQQIHSLSQSQPQLQQQTQPQQPQMLPVAQPQPQPHPSIFDHIQESNLAQIKAKVPVVSETVAYFGYDPKENIPADSPFIGCTFKIIEYEEINPKLIEKWCDTIKLAGGSFSNNLEDVTILVCETRSSSTYCEAMKLGKRCVTIYWINDVLAKDQLSHPWRAHHLPLSFSKTNKPLVDHIITITNFKGKERREVKEMILKTGAKYTEYFSQSNTLIICGNVGGEKYERAIEWKIPIANCQIISDILLNKSQNLSSMLAKSKYQLFNRGDPLKLSSFSEIRELMSPWTKPIAIQDKAISDKLSLINGATKELTIPINSNDDSGIATGGSNNSDLDTTNGKLDITGALITANGQDDTSKYHNSATQKEASLSDSKRDERTFPSSLITASSIGIHEENHLFVDSCPTKSTLFHDAGGIEDRNKDTRSLRRSKEPIRILFTHLDSSLKEKLEKFATKLGLGFASNPTNCTHLVVDSIGRTPKFICALNHANYILSYKWIIESNEANNILDEKHFILQDKVGEEKYSFNLVYSLLKRRKRSGLLFNNLIFFVTPSVMRNVANLKEMIESAGGVVSTRKPPTKIQIDQLKTDGKRLIVITCSDDFHLCSTLESYGVEIVNVEFVISGILRQDIDFAAHRIKTSRTLFIRPETAAPLAQISQPSPPKKLRLDDSSC